ncbi:MAG: ChaN family lipoprotein, partial [Burkholderiales bacterium]|nr:ChaN family lipoprotein [Burkholderiales bacterium]
MNTIKRTYLIATLVFLLNGIVGSVAHSQTSAGKVDPQRPILDTRTQKTLSVAELIQKLDRVDYILLGEFHDNPSHHQLRGEFILRLNKPKQAVIVEYLLAGKEVRFTDSTLDSLHAAGFN